MKKTTCSSKNVRVYTEDGYTYLECLRDDSFPPKAMVYTEMLRNDTHGSASLLLKKARRAEAGALFPKK